MERKLNQMRQKVSAAIITLNEEKNLPRCLQGLTWVDEIVVVDAGSTDRTVEIAQQAGARVFFRPWPGYAKQWENAIELCSSPWILITSADTCMEPELAAEIQEALSSPGDIRGFFLPYKHFFLGKWIKHCGWYPAPSLRLLRKDSIILRKREVHESFDVTPGIVQELTKGHVQHYTYHSLHHYLEKFNNYTDLDARELVKSGASFTRQDMLMNAFNKFNQMYFEQKGFLDGLHGLVLSVLSALYELVKIAKVLELNGEFERGEDTE